MSVINQVLLDLEMRRASEAESSALPDHVRALPAGERAARWRWHRVAVVGGLAVVAGLAGAWLLLSAFDVRRSPPPPAVAPRPGAEVAIEKGVAARAAATAEAPAREERGRAKPDTPVSRPSVEPSGPPSTVTAQSAAEPSPAEAKPSKDPLPAASVIGRAGAESDARGETRARAAAAPTPAPAARVEPAPLAARPKAAAKAPTGVAAAKPEIRKQARQPAPRDLAENEYRKATESLHQGRVAEAHEGFQAALNLYPGHHGARQGLVGLLVEGRRPGEAERVLQEGVKLAPAQIGFVMMLARLQVDRGDNPGAIETLQHSLGHAQGSADYPAFLAALLQRQGRHQEAIEQYQAALRLRPASGVWLLGLGISLQAVNRGAEAQDAYRRAKASNSLNPELAAFADQRLRQLQ